MIFIYKISQLLNYQMIPFISTECGGQSLDTLECKPII
jgi:hypothetical protein